MKYVILALLAACNIQVSDGSTKGDDSTSDTAAAGAKAAAPGACTSDYMVGKEYQNVAATNGMGFRKLNLNDKCEMAVSNCSQTVKFPENLEIRLDSTIHIVTTVEITGVNGWSNCMSTGVKTCDVTLVTFGAGSMFVLSCTGEAVQYNGTR